MNHKAIKFIVIFIVIFSNISVAGTPHTAYGRIFNSDSSVPNDNDITFNAYIKSRPSEILTENSYGCSYSSNYWSVSVGDFPTNWSVGDILHVDVVNSQNNETGSIEVVMTNSGSDSADDLYLSAETLSPAIFVDPTSHDYGLVNVGDNEWQEFVIINEGTSDLIVSSAFIIGSDADQFSLEDSSEFILGPNEGWFLFVEFAPTSGGTKYATLRINSNDIDESVFDVPLTGQCIMPSLTVTSPNGGENWQVGSTHLITWDSDNTSGNVNIYYSINSGSSWAAIVSNTTDDGSYLWTVPNAPSTSCLVRITDVDGNPSDQSNYVFTISIEPSITVTSPNGGENWQVGSTHTITWDSYNTSGNVNIYYSINNGSSWSAIVSNIADDGSYQWTVPNVPSSTSCLVRIADVDGSPSDQSNYVFTISIEPSITVTSPNGGENWQVGSTHTITWDSYNTSGNVNIYYSINNGSSWSAIVSNIADDGSYLWTVPNAPSTSCLVRIADVDGSPSDQSNYTFTISKVPSITVSAPNGGEDWQVGSTHLITWDSDNTSGNVNIYYSINNGSSWSAIVSNTADDGSYQWTVPNVPSSTSCLVRVTDVDGNPSDQSNSAFTISQVPSISITSPNGGENWQVGSTHLITWDSDNTSGNVNIYYSINSGSSWAAIVSNTTDDGSYLWTVPNAPSTSCLVRITDVDGNPSDQSNYVFTISIEPSITVTSPNGGENWQIGSYQKITWISNSIQGNIKIEYSTNSGSTWHIIDESIDNTGSYNWKIPDNPSSQCVVRISDMDGDPSDQSDSIFSITQSQDINVTFQCNMSVKIQEQVFSPYEDTMVVRGNFNDWIGNANSIWDSDGDSVYTGTFDVGTEPTISYKFVIQKADSSVIWEEMSNRTFENYGSQTLPVTFFDNDSTIYPPNDLFVTFQCNMSFQINKDIFIPTEDIVVVRGSYNGWAGNNDQLTDTNNDNIFTGTFNVGTESVISYKYVIHKGDGTDVWEESTDNRKFNNTSDQTLDVVYFDNDTNYKPDVPILTYPASNSYLSSSRPKFIWQVPYDSNDDFLHIKVEISYNETFMNQIQGSPFNSWQNSQGFAPTPPLKQNEGSCEYNVQSNLSNREYWWRVSAWDGYDYSDISEQRYFIIDTVFPVIDSLFCLNADYGNSWYNQNNTFNARIQIQFDELHINRIQLSTSGLGDPASQTPGGGIDQKVNFNISIGDNNDGKYTLTAQIYDQAMNDCISRTDIYLDSTPPTETKANSPSTSSATIFSVTWGEGSDGSGAGLSGKYNLRKRVDNGTWTNWLSNFSGTDAIFTGEHGHTYSFEAAAWDNVGNMEEFTGVAETSTVIDTTSEDLIAPPAPLELIANGSNPSPWQKGIEFSINWTNPFDPSGIAAFYCKLGSAPNANEDTTFTSKASPPIYVTATQENGQTLYVWLEDGSGNLDYHNYTTVNLRFDQSPPTGYYSNAPDTNFGSHYTVSIFGANDGAGCGVEKIYFDVFTSSNESPSIIRNSMDGITTEGIYYYRYFAVDSLGNTGDVKTDTTFVFTEQKFIILNSPTGGENWEIGTEQNIYWSTSENINNIKIELSRDNNISREFLGSSSTHTGSYTWKVTGPISDNCILIISDIETAFFSKSENIFSITPQSVALFQSGTTQPFGSAQSAYRLISIPGKLNESRARHVLEDNLGSYDKAKWRLFDYYNGLWLENPDTLHIWAGRSYFLIVKESGKKIDAGAGYYIGDKIFNIGLNSGWNLISNPFNFNINQAQLALNNDEQIKLFGYEGSWVNTARIEPWKGYAIHVNNQSVLTISPNLENFPKPGNPELEWIENIGTEWHLQIKARCDSAYDASNYCGVIQNAQIGHDKYDSNEPPFIGEYVAVYFPHPDWGKYSDLYTADFLPPSPLGYEWSFVIKTIVPNPIIQIDFDYIEKIPTQYDISLLNENTGTWTDLRQTNSFFTNTPNTYFKLMIGPKEFVEKTNPLPSDFELTQNFPNPFNPETEIMYHLPKAIHVKLKIYNLNGQEIKSLIDKFESAGLHHARWDGTLLNGEKAPSGIYLYQLSAGKFKSVKKMVLAR